MKIGFDSKRLYCNFTGLGNYSRTLVRNLQNYHPENEYNLYTPKLKLAPETSFFAEHANIHTHKAQTSLKTYWRSFSILRQLQKDKIDLYHGLSNEIPFGIKRSGLKSVVTIHDLIFKVLPETYPIIDKTFYDIKFRNSCRNADRIIAISNNTKKDIVELYNIEPDKIEVIYQACDTRFYEPIDKTENNQILKSHNVPNDYLLYVGSIEKRKNLKGIIEAYSFLSPDFIIPIVVIGGFKDKSYKKELGELISKYGLEQIIIFISNLKDNNSLQGIYQNAQALVYPSFYEGFGLPIAESLLSKTPVITSIVSSLPEAGGPKSLYINPQKPEEIAHAIQRVLSDSALRNTMIEMGYDYAKEQFSPKRVTERLIECYEKTIAT